MKKTKIIISAIIIVLAIIIVWNLKDYKKISGQVVSYIPPWEEGEDVAFELQEDKLGVHYGLVITKETEFVWEDTSTLEYWEGTINEGDELQAFGEGQIVEVVVGEKTESIDDEIDECVKEWYYAKKIKVLDAEEYYGNVAAKPVIYLYPEKVMDVAVNLEYDGMLTCTYPEYNNGWQVTAQPDGTLTDDKGQSYNYLYWEGITDITYDFSKGFCVPGEDTAEFLEKSLAQLGLNRKEANEFIVYWLPLMQENPYNLISFQQEAYTEQARLNISPCPDTLIRVFMSWKPLVQAVAVEPQQLTAPERKGFTVVEWGGTKVEK